MLKRLAGAVRRGGSGGSSSSSDEEDVKGGGGGGGGAGGRVPVDVPEDERASCPMAVNYLDVAAMLERANAASEGGIGVGVGAGGDGAPALERVHVLGAGAAAAGGDAPDAGGGGGDDDGDDDDGDSKASDEEGTAGVVKDSAAKAASLAELASFTGIRLAVCRETGAVAAPWEQRGRVVVWDQDSRAPLGPGVTGVQAPRGAAWCAGRTLAVCENGGHSISYWEFDDDWRPTKLAAGTQLQYPQDISSGVNAETGQQVVAVGGSDGDVHIIDASISAGKKRFETLRTFKGGGWIWGCGIDESNWRVCVATNDLLATYDIDTGKKVEELHAPGKVTVPSTSLGFGSFVRFDSLSNVLLRDDGGLAVYTPDMRRIVVLPDRGGPVTGVHIDEMRQRLVIGLHNGGTAVVERGNLVKSARKH